MAINLPSNLYSGEAERINMFPHIQFQTQLMAHRKAKDEALDDYYKKLPDTINDKGVRDKEVPIINQKKNEIQDFWLKNRAAIKNPKSDNGAAQFNLQKMYRDAYGIVRDSQNAAKTDLEIGKKRFEKGSEYIFQDPDFINKQLLHDLPVNDPNRVPIDLAHITIPPPPFDELSYNKKFTDIKGDDDTPIIKTHPTDKYSNLVITPKRFSEDAKQAIYQRAATEYENNPSFKKQIDVNLAKNPENLNILKETFAKAFGHPIQNEHDVAAAYTLQNLVAGQTKQEVKDNGLRAKEAQERSFNQQKEMQQRGFRHSEAMAKEKLGAAPDTNINDIYENIQTATDNPNAAILQGGKRVGTRVNTLNSDAQKVLVDYANKLRPNEKIGNDNIFINKEPDGTIKLYRTIDMEDGSKVVQKDDAHLIGELPRVTANLPAQPGAKEKRAVIAEGNEPKVKKTTKSGLPVF